MGFTIFPWCIDVIIPYDQSAVHRSFAVADNLGEISAKAQVIIFLRMYYIKSLFSSFGLET